MENAAEGFTTPEIVTEEIVAATEEIAAEVKEEVIEAPSRLREKFRRLEAMWGRDAPHTKGHLIILLLLCFRQPPLGCSVYKENYDATQQ